MITQKRISLWSGPRNVSTALMYAFAQRADTAVLDEPLYGHYLRVSQAPHPGREEVLASMEVLGEVVVREVILGEHHRPLLFIKNMAHHLVDLDWSFLDQLVNVLLIRDPREMIPSLVNQVPHPQMLDTALQMQWELFSYLRKNGQNPLVVDSRELLLDPPKILSAICRSLAIPYYPSMTHWSPGPRAEDGIWARHWYHQVHKSQGFAPYKPKNEAVRKDLLPLLDQCMIYYEKLFEHALKS